MLCNDVEKLSNFACNLGILRKKILLMPYGNNVKMYKIMTYQRMLPGPDSPFSQVPKALSILVSLSWGASTPFFRNGMWAFLKQSPMTQPLFLCKSVLPFLFFSLTKASGFLPHLCLSAIVPSRAVHQELLFGTKH
jgi:hypothetical protein